MSVFAFSAGISGMAKLFSICDGLIIAPAHLDFCPVIAAGYIIRKIGDSPGLRPIETPEGAALQKNTKKLSEKSPLPFGEG
jgi:hypothetical protein